MTTDFRINKACRLCGGELAKVFELGCDSPLANELLRGFCSQDTFPLYLSQCQDPLCRHVQLPVVVNPERLFREYLYQSGVSETFRRHFAGLAELLTQERDGAKMLPDGAFVVEIGANDGTLCSELSRRGSRTFGVDPKIHDHEPYSEGYMEDFFGAEAAASIREGFGQADCVVANNVLAHIDDLDDVMHGVRTLLADDGILVFEVQYLTTQLEKGLWGNIYAEHLDYWHLVPLERYLSRFGLFLTDAYHVPTHGGSIRCFAKKGDGPLPANTRLKIMRAEETGLDVTRFQRALENDRLRAKSLLDATERDGRRAVAYGCPAKLTTIMYGTGLDQRHVVAVGDDNPLKQGRYTPGH
jgi:SAM-dependent methyltransferase